MFPPSVFFTFCLFGDGEMSVGRFPPAQCVQSPGWQRGQGRVNMLFLRCWCVTGSLGPPLTCWAVLPLPPASPAASRPCPHICVSREPAVPPAARPGPAAQGFPSTGALEQGYPSGGGCSGCLRWREPVIFPISEEVSLVSERWKCLPEVLLLVLVFIWFLNIVAHTSLLSTVTVWFLSWTPLCQVSQPKPMICWTSYTL